MSRMFPNSPHKPHKLTFLVLDCVVSNCENNAMTVNNNQQLAATLRWFTAGGTIHIAARQLSQTWKLRHYDVIDDVITRKL